VIRSLHYTALCRPPRAAASIALADLVLTGPYLARVTIFFRPVLLVAMAFLLFAMTIIVLLVHLIFVLSGCHDLLLR
jgi:hypothetical protein